MNIFAVRFFLFHGQFRKDILAHTYGATDITSKSATLIGKAYDDFASSSSPMIAWFNYGTASGLYIGRTQKNSNYSSDCHSVSGKVTNVINGKGIEKAMVIGRGLGGGYSLQMKTVFIAGLILKKLCVAETLTHLSLRQMVIYRKRNPLT